MAKDPSNDGADRAGGNDQLTPHYANGSRGKGGSTPYSEWVLTAAAKRAEVLGRNGHFFLRKFEGHLEAFVWGDSFRHSSV